MVDENSPKLRDSNFEMFDEDMVPLVAELYRAYLETLLTKSDNLDLIFKLRSTFEKESKSSHV